MVDRKFVLLEARPWRSASLATALAERGNLVAHVSPPRPAWLPAHGTDCPPGVWRNENTFTLTPRTWLPMLRLWPFNGGGSWKGGERFSVPRSGVLLRETGFAHADAVVVRGFGLPHLIRHLQPSHLLVVLENDPGEDRELPHIVRRRAGELIVDADTVLTLSESARRAAKMVNARSIVSLESGDPRAMADAIIPLVS